MVNDFVNLSEIIQREAASEGFRWPSVAVAIEKVQEELDELKEWAEQSDSDEFLEEFGDLLFACIGLTVPSGLSATAALENANRKFIARYDRMKSSIVASGQEFSSLPLSEKLEYWKANK